MRNALIGLLLAFTFTAVGLDGAPVNFRFTTSAACNSARSFLYSQGVPVSACVGD